MDRLDDLVGLEPFLAAFAAEARILDPAERRVGGRDGEGVDPDHAAFDRVAEQIGAAAVLGEGEGGEPEGQAVGLLDRFVEGGELGGDRDRAERLLVHDVGGDGDVAEQGRLEEEARLSPRWPPARTRAPLAAASLTSFSISSGRRALASGPIFVSAARPSPVFTLLVRSAKPLRKAS